MQDVSNIVNIVYFKLKSIKRVLLFYFDCGKCKRESTTHWILIRHLFLWHVSAAVIQRDTKSHWWHNVYIFPHIYTFNHLELPVFQSTNSKMFTKFNSSVFSLLPVPAISNMRVIYDLPCILAGASLAGDEVQYILGLAGEVVSNHVSHLCNCSNILPSISLGHSNIACISPPYILIFQH